MAYFNFERLITKYSADFTFVTSGEGRYVSGVWQPGTEERTELSGAIIALTETKLYQSGGTLTAQDRVLYMLEPLEKPLEGAKVEFEGAVYRVEEDQAKGNEKFTGVYAYTLKRVSAVDRTEKQ